jgi:capsular polysaccharide transport system permease protein
MMPWLRRNWMFVILVLAPTSAAALYYGLLASDIYVSEARFLVRSPQRSVQTGLVGQLLQSSGLSRSQDDAYSVHDYILSRDALRELDASLRVRLSYAGKEVDLLSRFPGLDWDDSFESFFRYYIKHVGVEYDSASSISVLSVRAFSAEDAYRISARLLEMSERLINQLNDRSRRDLMSFSDNEVKIASDKAKEAALALSSYRNGHSIFEPDKQAALQLQSVAKIQEELVSTVAELSQLRKLSPSNPQIQGLTGRIKSLRDAIASEASKVTGARDSLSAHAPQFERLSLDVVFADKQLGIALAEQETARAEALQKQIYLERLVQPNLPDKAMEPRRVRSILTVLLLGLVGWGVMTLLIASVREHSD